MGFTEYLDPEGREHLAPGSPLYVLPVSEALMWLFDLDEYSAGRLNLCSSGPDCEFFFDELSLNFYHPQGMENPEGLKNWDLASLQHQSGKTGKSEALPSYLGLDMPSTRVHSRGSTSGQALEVSLRNV